jgi:LSD1 subclass zinc finger protein
VIDGVLPEGCCARLKGPAARGSGEDGSRLGDYRNEKDLGSDEQLGSLLDAPTNRAASLRSPTKIKTPGERRPPSGNVKGVPSGNIAETRKAKRDAEREQYANQIPAYIEASRARIWKELCTCRTPWDQTSGAHGVHCPECHTNFASGVANYLHRPMFATECKDPGDVIDVDWGHQLLGMEYRNGLPVWFVKPHRNTRRVVP